MPPSLPLALLLAVAPAPGDQPPAAVPSAPRPVVSPALVASEPATPPPAPAPPPSPYTGDDPATRKLLAGGVMLPLGIVVLCMVGYVASDYQPDRAEADALRTALATRPGSAADRARLRGLLESTRRAEGLIVGLSLTGGALIAAGTTLLIHGGLQRRRARLGLDLRSQRFGLTLSGEF